MATILDHGSVLNCTVNDFQEQKLFGGLRKIVTYLVTVTKHSSSKGSPSASSSSSKGELFTKPIRRRYSDFDWLFNIITQRYRGTWLPPMPEKNIVNTAEAFIKDRMLRLNQFLNRLVGNPYMRHDTALKAFLTVPAGRKWDQTKKEHDKAEQSVRDINNLQFARPPKVSISSGLTEWYDALENTPEPPDTDTAILATKTYFAKYEGLLRQMVEATGGLVKVTEDYSSKLNDLQDALGEYNTAIAKSSFAQLQTADIMMPIADAFHQWYSFQDAQTGATQLFWDQATKDELALVRSFLALLARYEQTAQQQQVLVNKKDRAFSDLQKAKQSGKLAQITKVEGLLKDLEAKVTLADKMRKREAKAIVVLELRRFANWRQVAMRRRIGQFAAIQLAASLKARAQWQSLAKELGSDSIAKNDAFAVLPFRCDSFGQRSDAVTKQPLEKFQEPTADAEDEEEQEEQEEQEEDKANTVEEEEEDVEDEAEAVEEEELEESAGEVEADEGGAFGVVDDDEEEEPAPAEEEEVVEEEAAEESEEVGEEGVEIDLGGDDAEEPAEDAPESDNDIFGDGDEDDDPFGEDVSMM